jgi:mannose-6-phosphate isomerase-like protein (cupin superfamily)
MIVKRNAIEAIDFAGLQIYDYTAGHQTQSSLAVIEVLPGAQHPEAWSKRSDKYYYVIAGQVQFVLAGKQYALAAGDFCLVQQGEHFSYQNQTDAPATLLLVHTPSFDLETEVFVEA